MPSSQPWANALSHNFETLILRFYNTATNLPYIVAINIIAYIFWLHQDALGLSALISALTGYLPEEWCFQAVKLGVLGLLAGLLFPVFFRMGSGEARLGMLQGRMGRWARGVSLVVLCMGCDVTWGGEQRNGG